MCRSLINQDVRPIRVTVTVFQKELYMGMRFNCCMILMLSMFLFMTFVDVDICMMRVYVNDQSQFIKNVMRLKMRGLDLSLVDDRKP